MISLPSFVFCQRLLAVAILFLLVNINMETLRYVARLYGRVSFQIVFRGLLVLKDLFALHVLLGRVIGFVRTCLPLRRGIRHKPL